MSDEPWNPTPPGWVTTPKPTARTGEEIWRVSRQGHTMICVLYNDAKAGAAWEVVLKQDDEWLFGRRCSDEAFARFVARGMLQEHLHGAWTAATSSIYVRFVQQ